MGSTVISMYLKQQLAGLIEEFQDEFWIRDDPGFNEDYAETGLRDWLNARHEEDTLRLEYAEHYLQEAMMPTVDPRARERHLAIVLRELRAVKWKLSRGHRRWPECRDSYPNEGYVRDEEAIAE